MYVGIIVTMLMLVLFSGIRKGAKIASALALGLVVLLVIVGTSGIELKGRVGPVDSGFYFQHLKGILLNPEAPAVGSVFWRIKILSEVWNRWTASPATVVLGEGFGKPLIDFRTPEGVAVRQPHNTHLTILVRLGLIGLITWVFINWRIFALFIRALRRYQRGTLDHDLALWFLIFYVLGMLLTTVQPWLEFSYGAIPFFTLVGFALGFIQKH